MLSHPPNRRWLEIALMSSVLVVGVLLCVPALHGMSHLWRSTEFYGHAYAIPAVSAWLLYRDRRALAEALRDPQPPRLGPLIAFGAGAFEALAVAGDVGFGAGIGMPLVIGAAGYAIGGRRLLGPLLLPLAFLVLMVPPPHFLTDEILFRLKLFVTELAVHLLQLGGHTLAAQGNQVLLPRHTLFVADACSGLTSIITLLPLSCIVAYLLSHGVWRRALVVASVLPLALGANVARVVLTVSLVESRGAEFSQGLLHESFGLATYVVGTLFLIGFARVLR